MTEFTSMAQKRRREEQERIIRKRYHSGLDYGYREKPGMFDLSPRASVIFYCSTLAFCLIVLGVFVLHELGVIL